MVTGDSKCGKDSYFQLLRVAACKNTGFRQCSEPQPLPLPWCQREAYAPLLDRSRLSVPKQTPYSQDSRSPAFETKPSTPRQAQCPRPSLPCPTGNADGFSCSRHLSPWRGPHPSRCSATDRKPEAKMKTTHVLSPPPRLSLVPRHLLRSETEKPRATTAGRAAGFPSDGDALS